MALSQGCCCNRSHDITVLGSPAPSLPPQSWERSKVPGKESRGWPCLCPTPAPPRGPGRRAQTPWAWLQKFTHRAAPGHLPWHFGRARGRQGGSARGARSGDNGPLWPLGRGSSREALVSDFRRSASPRAGTMPGRHRELPSPTQRGLSGG